MYYSVLGLNICTLHCNVISVKTLFFLMQLRALPSARHFWCVIFMFHTYIHTYINKFITRNISQAKLESEAL